MSIKSFETLTYSRKTVLYLEKNTSLNLVNDFYIDIMEDFHISDLVSAENPNQVRI